jgi:hypothetical protein
MLWPLGIFDGYFMTICYILCFVLRLFLFGIMYQEKSGNPVPILIAVASEPCHFFFRFAGVSGDVNFLIKFFFCIRKKM